MMAANSGEELLVVEYVKLRTSDAGKSPIGALFVFSEYIEWRDSSSPNRTRIHFSAIKGQKVSPPHKQKIQLQICLQDEAQNTFVFLKPGTREEQVADRDAAKETLQQALVAHRQRVQQMTISAEKGSRDAEIEEKSKILKKNPQLQELYKHLVTSKLLMPTDFWTDYYKTTGKTEERMGMNGSFLANIAQADANGLKLNLNNNIIQNIFATYPMVERKHLELVPHEMSEEQFWVKFATSHYFHREREVLPNPDDPFADCVKADEEEISKLVSAGAKRKRLNFDYLSDNVVAEINGAQRADPAATASSRDKQRATLIRRCNFLSERILQTQQQSAATGAATTAASSSSTGAAGAAPATNGTASNGLNGEGKSNGGGGGYAMLHRWIGDEEDPMESAELAEEECELQLQPIKIAEESSAAGSKFTDEEAVRYRSIVADFLDDVSESDILNPSDDWFASPSTSSSSRNHANGFHSGDPESAKKGPLDPATQWGALTPYVGEIRVVHDAVNELVKHFWTCFPPVSPELEAKIERMEQTLKKYEQSTLAEAEERFGFDAFLHTRDMIGRAHERYAAYHTKKNEKKK